MALLSALVLVLLATVQLPTCSDPSRPISFELQDGNPLAWLLIGALCLVILTFAHRLKRNGHHLRTLLLLFDAFGLLIVACTSPERPLHEGMLLLISVLTILWFTIAALDYDCFTLLILSAACIVLLPLLAFFGVGLAEKGLILYCLFGSNLVYYIYLDSQGRQRW